MKKLLFGITFFFFLASSCNEKKTVSPVSNKIYLASTDFKLDIAIEQIADKFLDSIKGVSAIKEMTINRIYENEYVITCRAKTNSPRYFEEHHPLLIYRISDRDSFFIYSGIELLVRGNNDNISAKYGDSTATYFCVRYILKDGVCEIDKICNDPFFPPPKYAEPPKIDIKKYTPGRGK